MEGDADADGASGQQGEQADLLAEELPAQDDGDTLRRHFIHARGARARQWT